MGVPKTLSDLIPFLDAAIAQYHLHSTDSPVNLQSLLNELNINLKYSPISLGIHGYSFWDSDLDPQMTINIRERRHQQRSTEAHELIHIVKHAPGHERYSFDGQPDDLKEAEADYGAAYLLVPLRVLKERVRAGLTFEQIAGELEVTKSLVYKRYEIALAMREL